MVEVFLSCCGGGGGFTWVDCNQAEHGRNLECPRDSHGERLLYYWLVILVVGCWYAGSMDRVDSLK